MKKIRKIILYIVIILFFVIVIDTIQAKIFNNSPVIHIRKYYNSNSEINYIDNGILVSYYQYKNGENKIIFVWENRTY